MVGVILLLNSQIDGDMSQCSSSASYDQVYQVYCVVELLCASLTTLSTLCCSWQCLPYDSILTIKFCLPLCLVITHFSRTSSTN